MLLGAVKASYLAIVGLPLQPVAMPRPLPDTLLIEWPESQSEPSPLTEQAIDRAVAVLRAEGLVAIPTETVYGLAADALSGPAVEKIFRAKRRPATNPLIVHVADLAMARGLTAGWPLAAEQIATHLWPGPVTIIVPRGPALPDQVLAGGPTVALRCPDHRLTRRLIKKLGRPLAAPSANRSESVSPTSAQHVLASLGNRIDLILDGGACACGIESTVVDCTTDPPQILRPGPLGREALEEVLGRPVKVSGEFDPGNAVKGRAGEKSATARSPGQHSRHYATKTPLELSADSAGRVAGLLQAGQRVGWLSTDSDSVSTRLLAASHNLVVVPMPLEPVFFARQLYAMLHALDQRGLDVIVVDTPPLTEAWRAIHDRLSRAACTAIS